VVIEGKNRLRAKTTCDGAGDDAGDNLVPKLWVGVNVESKVDERAFVIPVITVFIGTVVAGTDPGLLRVRCCGGLSGIRRERESERESEGEEPVRSDRLAVTMAVLGVVREEIG